MAKQEYEIKTYGKGTIYLEEGMYEKSEILKVLEQFNLLEKRSKQLMEDMRKTVESHES